MSTLLLAWHIFTLIHTFHALVLIVYVLLSTLLTIHYIFLYLCCIYTYVFMFTLMLMSVSYLLCTVLRVLARLCVHVIVVQTSCQRGCHTDTKTNDDACKGVDNGMMVLTMMQSCRECSCWYWKHSWWYCQWPWCSWQSWRFFVLSSSLLGRRAEGGLALHLVQDVLIRWDSSQCIDLTFIVRTMQCTWTV